MTLVETLVPVTGTVTVTPVPGSDEPLDVPPVEPVDTVAPEPSVPDPVVPVVTVPDTPVPLEVPESEPDPVPAVTVPLPLSPEPVAELPLVEPVVLEPVPVLLPDEVPVVPGSLLLDDVPEDVPVDGSFAPVPPPNPGVVVPVVTGAVDEPMTGIIVLMTDAAIYDECSVAVEDGVEDRYAGIMNGVGIGIDTGCDGFTATATGLVVETAIGEPASSSG